MQGLIPGLGRSWVGTIPWRRDRLPTAVFFEFPGGSDGKESACNAGDLGLIPGLRRSPGGRAWQSTLVFLGLPGGLDGKRSACNAGDLGLIPEWGRSPGGGHDNLLQYPCLENPHGQRSLAGYSPWGCKELDISEQLGTAQSILIRGF